jgi:transposase-like protein
MGPWETKSHLGGRQRTSHGTIQRVAADQIGCGVESLRTWVKQADIDEGVERGLSTPDAKRIKELEQQSQHSNRKLREVAEEVILTGELPDQ